MKKFLIVISTLVVLFTLTSCFSLEGVEYIEFYQKPSEIYEVDNGPNLSNISIAVKLSTSETKTILPLSSSEVTVLGLDFNSTGKKTITVKYKGFTVSSNYYVVDEIISDTNTLYNRLEGETHNLVLGLEGKEYVINQVEGQIANAQANTRLVVNNGHRIIGQTGTVLFLDQFETENKVSWYGVWLLHGTIENLEIKSEYGSAGADNTTSGVMFHVQDGKTVNVINCFIRDNRSGLQGRVFEGGLLNLEGNYVSNNRTGLLIDQADGTINIFNNQIVANKTFGFLFGNVQSQAYYPDGPYNYDDEGVPELDPANLDLTPNIYNPTLISKYNAAITSAENPTVASVSLRKNVIADNWYAQIESRFPQYILDISQNYFGGEPIINDNIAYETVHPSDGGVYIRKPEGDRDRHLFFPEHPSMFVYPKNNPIDVGGVIYNKKSISFRICGGYVINSYYTDIECTNLESFNS